MNSNEYKLREITLSLSVLSQKDGKLTSKEQELYDSLIHEREKLLKTTDAL